MIRMSSSLIKIIFKVYQLGWVPVPNIIAFYNFSTQHVMEHRHGVHDEDPRKNIYIERGKRECSPCQLTSYGLFAELGSKSCSNQQREETGRLATIVAADLKS